MLYFFLSIGFSVSILALFRKFEALKIDNLRAIWISYIISIVLASLSSLLLFGVPQAPQLHHLLMAAVLGISFFFGFRAIALCSQKVSVSATSIAGNMSVVIPVFVAALLYHEKLNLLQWLGFTLAFPAIYLFFKQKNGFNIGSGLWIYPAILLVISGFNNSVMRHAEKSEGLENPIFFLSMILVGAFVSSSSFNVVNKKFINFTKNEWIYGALLGLLNFASSLFFLLCLKEFETAIFFPVYNLTYIGIAAVVGIWAFKEKYHWLNYMGLALAAIAIALMNWK